MAWYKGLLNIKAILWTMEIGNLDIILLKEEVVEVETMEEEEDFPITMNTVLTLW